MMDRKEGKVYLGVYQVDRAIQVNIGNGCHGYRLCGPKFSGISTKLREIELTERDAREIRSYLDEAFPPKKKTKKKSKKKSKKKAFTSGKKKKVRKK